MYFTRQECRKGLPLLLTICRQGVLIIMRALTLSATHYSLHPYWSSQTKTLAVNGRAAVVTSSTIKSAKDAQTSSTVGAYGSPKARSELLPNPLFSPCQPDPPLIPLHSLPYLTCSKMHWRCLNMGSDRACWRMRLIRVLCLLLCFCQDNCVWRCKDGFFLLKASENRISLPVALVLGCVGGVLIILVSVRLCLWRRGITFGR